MANSQDVKPEDILLNGLDFIEDATFRLTSISDEKVESADSRRELKYALLHLYAGIELALKFRLGTEHWSYIFADMNKANKRDLVSGNFRSVSGNDLVQRIENLCAIRLLEDEKGRLGILRNWRNRAEHFVLPESGLAIESIVLKCVRWLVQFLVDECAAVGISGDNDGPISRIKSHLLTMTRTLDSAKVIATRELEKRGLDSFKCPECLEEFLVIDGRSECLLCEYRADGSDAATAYLENVCEMSAYFTIKDGGYWPVIECPECGDEAFACAGDEAICFTCGFRCEPDQLSWCASCGERFFSCDGELSMCDNCHQWRLDSD